ncbi:MAG: phenylalanine-4-hydroxylase [Vicingaceae bacterium]|nr:phenylalanine-4-hydroxylase [Vicingaceae bacterium]
MQQNFNNYTKEDWEVWKILFERQVNNLKDKSCAEYLSCLTQLTNELKASIPDLTLLSTKIFNENGWSIEIVPGLIPVDNFFSLLAQKKFCSSIWIRKKSQLDYLEEPDMFHDIFGHIPLLLDTNFGSFAQQLGTIGVQHKNNPQVLLELQRLYWFTIEFGVLKTDQKLKIYGAGIISSFQETNGIFDKNTVILPFNLDEVIATDFNNMEIQTKYFFIESFEEVKMALSAYAKRLLVVKK